MEECKEPLSYRYVNSYMKDKLEIGVLKIGGVVYKKAKEQAEIMKKNWNVFAEECEVMKKQWSLYINDFRLYNSRGA